MNSDTKTLPIPSWLKAAVAANKAALRSSGAMRIACDINGEKLATVCEQALCPNRGRCYSEGEATFLILGNSCTRACSFCAVSREKPSKPDADEPDRIARTSKNLELRYIVFTSPTRDDLPDGGAEHYAKTINAIRGELPSAGIEPLVPDFAGNMASLETVLNSSPDVLAHNVETVPRLYFSVRKGSDYGRSLELLQYSKIFRPEILTKSGLMLGLGETGKEVETTLADILDCGCDLLTLGQYLTPSKKHHPVKRYLDPEEFTMWLEKAKKMGFKGVMSGPLVRSSFKAGTLYKEAKEATEAK